MQKKQKQKQKQNKEKPKQNPRHQGRERETSRRHYLKGREKAPKSWLFTVKGHCCRKLGLHQYFLGTGTRSKEAISFLREPGFEPWLVASQVTTHNWTTYHRATSMSFPQCIGHMNHSDNQVKQKQTIYRAKAMLLQRSHEICSVCH